MGIKVKIDGRLTEVVSYSVAEMSTPISGTDTSGGTGSMEVTIPAQDAFALLPSLGPLGKDPRLLMSSLFGKTVELMDSNRGRIIGKINSVTPRYDGARVDLGCDLVLNNLNLFNVQLPPFIGSFREAIALYFRTAARNVPFRVNDDIAMRQVTVPAWGGEFWNGLKMLCQANDIEITAIAGVTIFRAIRQVEVGVWRATAMTHATTSAQMARSVNVRDNRLHAVANAQVWPTLETNQVDSIFTVNAGEIAEYHIDFDGTFHNIVQPMAYDKGGRYDFSVSGYTIINSEGKNISAAAWNGGGGNVAVVLDKDFAGARIIITAPRRFVSGDAEEVSAYSLAWSPSKDATKEGTLRLLGTGVRSDPRTLVMGTSTDPRLTDQESFATVDNPFVGTANMAYRITSRAAREATGYAHVLSGEVVAVDPIRGLKQSLYDSYADDRARALVRTGGEGKYSSVIADAVNHWERLPKYKEYGDEFLTSLEEGYEAQVFGNIVGARIWHAPSRRYYRVRSSTITPESITFEAQDDLTYGDIRRGWDSRSYAVMKAVYNGLTNGQVREAGVYG